MTTLNTFRLDGKVAIITGGAGLLGIRHAEAVAEAGGIPVLWDVRESAATVQAAQIAKTNGVKAMGMAVDITDETDIEKGLTAVLNQFGRADILINNAARNPKVNSSGGINTSRLENFPLDEWAGDIAVGLTGAFLCSKVIGSHMAKNGGGVILNIASDLGVIAPDQRIYRKEGLADENQPAKPVTYSVVKHGLIGLTKYLATYWADKNVRCNAISPGGIYTEQPADFVDRLSNLIPMGRMAKDDEYKGAVLFLISDASSYMTGANLNVDGGRTCW